MENRIYILIGVIVSIFTLQACNLHEASSDDLGQVICFNASTEDVVDDTKGLVSGDLTSYKIYVHDTYSEDGSGFIPFMDNALFSYKDGVWTSSPEAYWTNYGKHYFASTVEVGRGGHLSSDAKDYLKFERGVTPDNDKLYYNNLSLGVVSDSYSQPDLLYAFAERNVDTETNPTSPVTLQFKHVLSAVEFKITNSGYENLSLKSLEIIDIQYEGSFSVTRGSANGTYTPHATYTGNGTSPYKVTGTSLVKNVESVYGPFLIWPATTISARLSITLSLAGEEKTLDDIYLSYGTITQWSAGHKYIYNITIPENSIQLAGANDISVLVECTVE